MPLESRTDGLARLHTDRHGSVWFADETDQAHDTRLDAADVVRDGDYLERLVTARAVRVLGTADNAELLTKLHELKLSAAAFKTKVVTLGSPGPVPGAWLQHDPAAVLQHLWQPTPAARLARHWHDMTQDDYVAYAMVAAAGEARDASAVPETVERTAAYHPAWPAVTFLPGVDRAAACLLLCHIVDPRWYQHPTRPGRLSKLYAGLGLTTGNLAAAAGDGGRPGRHFNRAANAVRVWYNQTAGRESAGPNAFLARTLKRHPHLARGLLRATQQLVRFVALVWLDGVCRTHREAGFSPRQFFRTEAEATAYARHRAMPRRV